MFYNNPLSRTRSTRFPQACAWNEGVDSAKDKGRAPRICQKTQDEEEDILEEGDLYR